MMRRGRIAVLFHEKDRFQPPEGYIVHRLADYWSKGEWTDTLEYAVLATEWCGGATSGR